MEGGEALIHYEYLAHLKTIQIQLAKQTTTTTKYSISYSKNSSTDACVNLTNAASMVYIYTIRVSDLGRDWKDG